MNVTLVVYYSATETVEKHCMMSGVPRVGDHIKFLTAAGTLHAEVTGVIWDVSINQFLSGPPAPTVRARILEKFV